MFSDQTDARAERILYISRKIAMCPNDVLQINFESKQAQFKIVSGMSRNTIRSFLTKIFKFSIFFCSDLIFLTKTSILWRKPKILTTISIFDQTEIFDQNFHFLTKTVIFNHNFDFWPNRNVWPKFRFFDQKFVFFDQN